MTHPNKVIPAHVQRAQAEREQARRMHGLMIGQPGFGAAETAEPPAQAPKAKAPRKAKASAKVKTAKAPKAPKAAKPPAAAPARALVDRLKDGQP